ncbi:MAG: ABC transporter permease [Pseudorhodoplanes sp.]
MSAEPRTAVPATSQTRWWTGIPFTAILGIAIIVGWVLAGLLAPWIAPYAPADIVSGDSFAPPGQVGILGTDYLGRDLLSRLLYGARLTIGLAFSATFLALCFGTLLGTIAAAYRGHVDSILSRLNDMFLSLPSIMLALVVITAFGSTALVLILTVAFVESVRVFRVARAAALDIYAMEFVEISHARGDSKWWIMRREVLPNMRLLLATDFGIRFSYSTILMSSLSFLGLGIQPPAADWGIMMRENLGGVNIGAAATLIPVVAIFSLNLAVNWLVDWSLSRQNRDISSELRS